MGVAIEDLLGKTNQNAQISENALSNNLPELLISDGGDITWSLPTMARNVYHSERLMLLYMLDRDQKIPPSKAVCRDCADTHDRSLFSSNSFAQPNCKRSCVGSVGRVWICPHWMFDHNLVTTSPEPKASHNCGDRDVSLLMLRGIGDDSLTPTMVWPITVLHGNDAPSKKAVEDILGLMDIGVCKHLRFTDAFVSRLYSPHCKKLRWRGGVAPVCRCSSCMWQLSQPHLAGYMGKLIRYKDYFTGSICESCGTDFYFQIADKDGQKDRKIPGMYGSCLDRANE
jgi:hypothetical protein